MKEHRDYLDRARAKLQQDLNTFLDSGGSIVSLPAGASGDETLLSKWDATSARMVSARRAKVKQ